MVDADEHSFEDSFDSGDVSEGDVGIGELAKFDLLVDDGFYKILDGFGIDFFEAAGGCFDGIGHHENCCFFGKGDGAGVSEGVFVDDFVGVVFEEGMVEILYFGGAVVG